MGCKVFKEAKLTKTTVRLAHPVTEILLQPGAAGRKLRVWRQASRAGGGVFTEVNWLKLRYILHITLLTENTSP